MAKTAVSTLSRILKWIAFSVLWTASLLGIASRRDLPMLWAYSAVISGLGLVGTFAIPPGLARERRRAFFGRAADLQGPAVLDRKIMMLLGAPSYVAHIVIAALDVGRFHWSDSVPFGLQLAALVVFAISWSLAIWAVAVNPFFSSVVRIQNDRGHVLITAGPYRYVRHPGYVGAILGMPASAIALGSWLSLVPAAIVSLLVLRRVVLEDAFLKDHLDGYTHYMERVRYRLLPGIW